MYSELLNKMTEPTLHQVLEDQYSLHDEIRCEGDFVRLIGTGKEAIGLASVGFTDRAVIVARINLANETKDFDLETLTPLQLVRVEIENYQEKIISIASVRKPLQIYQLCSSERQNDIWTSFTSFIKDTHRYELNEAVRIQNVLKHQQHKESINRLSKGPVIIPVQNILPKPTNLNNSCSPCQKHVENIITKYSARPIENLKMSVNCPYKTTTISHKSTNQTIPWEELDDITALIRDEHHKDTNTGLWKMFKDTIKQTRRYISRLRR